MNNIILTSSFVDVANHLKTNRLMMMRDIKKIAFIATAAEVEPVDFYVDEARTWFLNQDCELLDIRLKEMDFDTISEKLDLADVIYVSGGNTFFLLQELKKSKVDQLLINHIHRGKQYVGESAGSIVLAPSIDYVSLMDDANQALELKSLDALNIIDFYPVPHKDNEPFIEAVDEICLNYETERDIKAFSNNEIIIVKDGRFEKISY
ncbi:MAG: Type 1 glutamine amidotransferase-like domain-containing protein [Erysipelothrix sp.]